MCSYYLIGKFSYVKLSEFLELRRGIELRVLKALSDHKIFGLEMFREDEMNEVRKLRRSKSDAYWCLFNLSRYSMDGNERPHDRNSYSSPSPRLYLKVNLSSRLPHCLVGDCDVS